ncbi:hypothetical protein CWC54_05490 [Enterococcus faecium]|nr:hypothetical protein CWC54_05490 [Enterococcus faecium]
MRKYTFVFKKKVVSDYLNNEGGYKYLAHKYQINRTLVRHWVRIYNYHGWEGLVGGGKSYTTKFKLDVIEYMETNGLSIQETAKKFNIGSGWQYQMPQYQKKLKENNIIQSMSRKGNCLDNSVIENFFGVLKSEFFYREKFRSIEIFQSKLNEYIRWYNNKRIKLKLNGLSPVEYRKQSIK